MNRLVAVWQISAKHLSPVTSQYPPRQSDLNCAKKSVATSTLNFGKRKSMDDATDIEHPDWWLTNVGAPFRILFQSTLPRLMLGNVCRLGFMDYTKWRA